MLERFIELGQLFGCRLRDIQEQNSLRADLAPPGLFIVEHFDAHQKTRFSCLCEPILEPQNHVIVLFHDRPRVRARSGWAAKSSQSVSRQSVRGACQTV